MGGGLAVWTPRFQTGLGRVPDQDGWRRFVAPGLRLDADAVEGRRIVSQEFGQLDFSVCRSLNQRISVVIWWTRFT